MKKILENLYWKIIPYNWRPRQLWYYLKCWAWHRYSTVRPRYLPHTWCDRDHLLAHVMFEVLSDFIEGECSPGDVDWDSDNEHRQARKGLQDLYDWWNIVYKEYQEVEKILLKESERLGLKELSFIWNRKDRQLTIEEEICIKLLDGMNKLDIMFDKALQERLIKLIEFRKWMWT